MPITVCNVTTDSRGQELAQHGTTALPIACYWDDLQQAHVPWHWHTELEAVLVTSGTLIMGSGNTRYQLREGEGFLVNSGVLHGCWDGGNCQTRSIVFHPRLMGGSPDSIYQAHLQSILDLQEAGCLCFSPDIPWQRELLGCVDTVWHLVSQTPDGFEFPVRQQLTQILWLLHRNLPQTPPLPDTGTLRSAKRLKTMLQFIHDHYPERITVAHIACSAAISQSECLRCFQNVIRMSPIAYLRQYRIQQAARLLRNSQEKISVIAHSCGFEDMSFFSKTFRNLMGSSPSAYRRDGFSS